MAFLNKEERDALLEEIKDKRYPRIRGILNTRDPKARLAYFRNAQHSGRWMTRYVLEGLGTQVTLYEKPIYNEARKKREYIIEEIVVEPLPGNRL